MTLLEKFRNAFRQKKETDEHEYRAALAAGDVDRAAAVAAESDLDPATVEADSKVFELVATLTADALKLPAAEGEHAAALAAFEGADAEFRRVVPALTESRAEAARRHQAASAARHHAVNKLLNVAGLYISRPDLLSESSAPPIVQKEIARLRAEADRQVHFRDLQKRIRTLADEIADARYCRARAVAGVIVSNNPLVDRLAAGCANTVELVGKLELHAEALAADLASAETELAALEAARRAAEAGK